MNDTVKTHKVGCITLGTALIFFGILFLLRTFTNIISYTFVLKLWPIVFIILGLEILFSNLRHTEERFVYDKTSIFLIILLSFFAIIMAGAEFFISNDWYGHINY